MRDCPNRSWHWVIYRPTWFITQLSNEFNLTRCSELLAWAYCLATFIFMWPNHNCRYKSRIVEMGVHLHTPSLAAVAEIMLVPSRSRFCPKMKSYIKMRNLNEYINVIELHWLWSISSNYWLDFAFISTVPECFKDDNASQWKSGKFDSVKNPWTSRHLNLHGWLREKLYKNNFEWIYKCDWVALVVMDEMPNYILSSGKSRI